MKFTGLNLHRVRLGLALLHAEYHNMVVTCPDPVVYKDELEKYKQERDQVAALLTQTHRSIKREGKEVHHWTIDP
jgi:hypothetical protein